MTKWVSSTHWRPALIDGWTFFFFIVCLQLGLERGCCVRVCVCVCLQYTTPPSLFGVSFVKCFQQALHQFWWRVWPLSSERISQHALHQFWRRVLAGLRTTTFSRLLVYMSDLKQHNSKALWLKPPKCHRTQHCQRLVDGIIHSFGQRKKKKLDTRCPFDSWKPINKSLERREWVRGEGRGKTGDSKTKHENRCHNKKKKSISRKSLNSFDNYTIVKFEVRAFKISGRERL